MIEICALNYTKNSLPFLLEHVLMSTEYVVILFAISHILFSKNVFYSPIYGKSDKICFQIYGINDKIVIEIYGKSDKISSLKYGKNDNSFCKLKIINNFAANKC